MMTTGSVPKSLSGGGKKGKGKGKGKIPVVVIDIVKVPSKKGGKKKKK